MGGLFIAVKVRGTRGSVSDLEGLVAMAMEICGMPEEKTSSSLSFHCSSCKSHAMLLDRSCGLCTVSGLCAVVELSCVCDFVCR